MVWALLDGRALTASELAVAARITPQTASTHLAKLTEAGVLSVARHGRHRYFRFASPRVTDMIDGIVAVALEKRPRYRPLSRQARALNAARMCYDHLAGRLSVDLTDSFVARDYVVLDDEVAEITSGRHPFSHRVRDRASHAAFDPPPLLPTVPRLDRATPTHRGCGRGRDHQALLRSRLAGKDEPQPRGHRHPVGTAGLPEDLRHRRVRSRRAQETLVAPLRNSPRTAVDASITVEVSSGASDRFRGRIVDRA